MANSAQRACLADGGSAQECDGRAIRMANAMAQRAPRKSVKTAEDGSLRILAIPFGGPFADGDTDGERFSAKTDLCLDWYPTQRPLLFHHGLDDAGPGVTPVGRVDVSTAEKTAEGWWVRAWLDKQHAYFKQIGDLLDEEALFASSGAMPHLVRKAADGEILRWPWVELSLTPTPANLFAVVTPDTAKAHYKAAGLTPPPTLDTELPYLERVDRLTEDAVELLDLTRRLTAGRAKVGRPQMSDARRQRLTTLIAEMSAFLEETAPAPRAAADAAAADEAAAAEPEAKAEQKAPAQVQAHAHAPAEAQKAAGHAPEVAALFAQFQAFDALYAHIAVPGTTTTPTGS